MKYVPHNTCNTSGKIVIIIYYFNFISYCVTLRLIIICIICKFFYELYYIPSSPMSSHISHSMGYTAKMQGFKKDFIF